MQKILLTIFVIFIGYFSKAQVKGIVIDSLNKKPIERAIVGLVVKNNTSDTSYVLADENGNFQFSIVPSSNFSIIVSNIGYVTTGKFVSVSKPISSIDLGKIILALQPNTLDEVIVKAAPIIIKEDTVEYNASSFKVKDDAVVEDLLKKLPGVSVDKDGNVTAQGKSVTRVKVNGKDFFNGDVKTATKELPANIVDKIQMIDDYGDQATVSGIKDGDPDKVLNITIKKDKNKGFFGRATVGGGTNNRYQASLNGNYFKNKSQISFFGNTNNTNTSLFNFDAGGNRGATSMIRSGMSALNDMGGASGAASLLQSGAFSSGSNSNGVASNNSVGVNYRDQWSKRISVVGSYSYSHKNTLALTNTERQIFYSNPQQIILNNNQNVNQSFGDNHRFTFNVEYQIDSFNYLKVSPALSYSTNNGNNNTPNFTYYTNDVLTQTGSSLKKTDNTSPNLSGTILYNHKFRKRGRNFSSSISLGTSKSNSDQNITNLSTGYVTPFVGYRNTFQYINQDNNNYNYGVRLTYSEPLSIYRSLDLTYSHNLNSANNNKATYNVDSLTQIQTLNNYLSNNYENNFYNNRIGMSIRTTKKKYNYTLGISVQPVDLHGYSITKDSAYKTIRRSSIFPIARLVYNFSRTKSFNFNYSGNATQPTFTQLQPVVDNTNLQNITIGNPNLKPSITNNYNFSFNNFNMITGKILFTNLIISTTNNKIITNNINKGGGSQMSIPENVNGYYNLLGTYMFSKPIQNRKFVFNFNGNVNFNHNINLIDSIKNIGKNWLITQGFTFEYNYKELLELGTGISYSINDIRYKNEKGIAIASLPSSNSSAWIFSNNINLNITNRTVLKYDVDYTINQGLASTISKNLIIMNASIEQQLFKQKNGSIKFAAFDLFKQNSNISRTVSSNSIVDTRTNKLTRYFLLSFSYRLQKFAGKTQSSNSKNASGMPKINF